MKASVASNSSHFERSRQVYVVIVETPVSQNKIHILVNLPYAIKYCIRWSTCANFEQMQFGINLYCSA